MVDPFLKSYKMLVTLFDGLKTLSSSDNLDKINKVLQIIFQSVSENFSEPISEDLQEIFSKIIAEVGGSTISSSDKSTESNAKFNQIIAGITVNDDCSGVESLPNLTWTIDGIDYVMTPNDYVLSVE
jgi:hypothetical protein